MFDEVVRGLTVVLGNAVLHHLYLPASEKVAVGRQLAAFFQEQADLWRGQADLAAATPWIAGRGQ